MIRSELREDLARLLKKECVIASLHSRQVADLVLSIPHLKEALDFYEACQSAFEVNGEFKVTKEALRGKGGVSAS